MEKGSKPREILQRRNFANGEIISWGKFKIPDWRYVEDYLKKENEDGLRLAILEADKIFLKIINKKGHKAKEQEERISLAIGELNNPEVLLKAREVAGGIRDKINFDTGDVYNLEEIIKIYRMSLEELLYGEISEEKLHSWKRRFWFLYYYIFLNRKRILRICLWIIFIIFFLLFIADTSIGKAFFEYIILQLHFILRIFLLGLLTIFAVAFLVILFIVVLESYTKRKQK